MPRDLSLNAKLHLVIPIYDDEDEDKIIGYAHSAPISRETYDAHFMLIARTLSAIFEGGAGGFGPRTASQTLLKVAEKSDDPTEALDLLNEIRRLTNVVLRGPHGWETHQFQNVVDHRLISSTDILEVSNAILYFTVASAVLRKKERRVLTETVSTLGAQTSSSDFMAFAASLGTSTDGAHITSPTPASSVVF
jgi:hypothetical protein